MNIAISDLVDEVSVEIKWRKLTHPPKIKQSVSNSQPKGLNKGRWGWSFMFKISLLWLLFCSLISHCTNRPDRQSILMGGRGCSEQIILWKYHFILYAVSVKFIYNLLLQLFSIIGQSESFDLFLVVKIFHLFCDRKS